MEINEKLYKTLAWVGRYLLPALSVLYATIGKVWNLPYTEQIPLTINAVDVCLNTLLGISSSSYFKQYEIVEKENE